VTELYMCYHVADTYLQNPSVGWFPDLLVQYSPVEGQSSTGLRGTFVIIRSW
jgi:hypothetical protein